ncbi:MAG TPA: hypothetical protein VJK01_02570 [Candidatus Paceibacterota bacterium]
MNMITIPKNLIKNDDLVIIPRKKYEEFLRISKKKIYSQLDEDLNEAIEEVKTGKIIGPFRSAKTLVKSLRSKK